MAEEAITLIDKFYGLDAKVVGRDNAKDGADRVIGDIFIQTKYYKSDDDKCRNNNQSVIKKLFSCGPNNLFHFGFYFFEESDNFVA